MSRRSGRRRRSRITLVSPMARRSRISVERRGVAHVEAPAVGDRQREARALQQPAEVADLAHRRDARAEAAEGRDLGLGERGAELVRASRRRRAPRGRARRGGARGAPAPAGRPDRSPSAAPGRAATRSCAPASSGSVSSAATCAARREAGGGQRLGPERGARADDRRGGKRAVNLAQPFCDLARPPPRAGSRRRRCAAARARRRASRSGSKRAGGLDTGRVSSPANIGIDLGQCHAARR